MKRLKKMGFVTAVLFATLTLFVGLPGCTTDEQSKVNQSATTPAVSASAIMLKTNMRKLWEEHVYWTRNVILCVVDELPGTEQAVKRLMQNQVDIGNAFKTYYGEESGKKLTELLYAHVSLTADVVKASKAADPAVVDEVNKKWYSNADEIAAMLSAANPNWTLAEMKMMMNDHLKLTADEINQRVAGNYDADVIAFDKVHNEILKMSDMLSDGITRQFPQKF